MTKVWIILNTNTVAITCGTRHRTYIPTAASLARLKSLPLHFEFSGECGPQSFDAYTWKQEMNTSKPPLIIDYNPVSDILHLACSDKPTIVHYTDHPHVALLLDEQTGLWVGFHIEAVSKFVRPEIVVEKAN